MRGSLVVLALAVTPFLARVSSAQANAASSADDKRCVERQRGNPSATGLANRADPTTKGNKNCTPVVVGHTSVSGVVFFDLNGNGMFDAEDEVGISSWQVQISGPMTQTVMTAGDGTYSFTGLTPGNYTVCVLPPMGWSQVSPTSGPACDSGIGASIVAPALAGDVGYVDINFGYVSVNP
jgi:hypothetical protein